MKNRELKFRAWMNREKYFQEVKDYGLEGKNIYFTKENDFEIGYSFDVPFCDGRWTVQQFTGLFDANGEEIYEGDILDYQWGWKIGRVIFGEGGFAFDGVFGTKPFVHLFSIDLNKAKVIGNIYENPELLK